MSLLRCPHCHRRTVRRAPRVGRAERFLRHLGVHPFRCQLCGRRFRALRWSAHSSRNRADRREYDRAALTLPVSVSFHRTRASGSLTALSLGGAEIAGAFVAPEGALVQIEIEVPGAPRIAIDGALVRSVRPGTIGVQFVWARMEPKERLRELVLQALGHENVDEAMLNARGPGLRSHHRLGDLWLAALVVRALVSC